MGWKPLLIIFGSLFLIAACGGSLGVGGDHITNDMAVAFDISAVRAEKLKQEYGSAVVESEPQMPQIPLPAELGESRRTVSARAMQTVINARMKETFEMVKEQLDEAGALIKAGSGVILTGGGAELSGVDRLGASVFGTKCSLGSPHSISGIPAEIGKPENATCCGLLNFGFRHQQQMEKESGGSVITGLFKRLFGG